MIKYIILFLMILRPCFADQESQVVYFDFGKAENHVETFKLKDCNKECVFLIQGYSDPTGDENYNRFLSHERAEFVKRKLISEYGVISDQIKIVFHGEDHTEGLTDAEKRRTEITVGTASEIAELIKNLNLKVFISNKKSQLENERPYVDGKVSGDTIAENKDPISSEQPSTHHEDNLVSSNKKELNTKKFKSKDLEKPLVEKKSRSRGKYQDRYYVGAGVYNNILTAGDRGTNSSAKWVSGENYNIEAQYQFKYKKFWFGINGSYHLQDYEVELNPIFTWDEKTPSLLRLSLVSDYETKKWGLGFDVDYHQTSFVYEESFNVELRDIFMLGVSLRAKYKWLETDRWSSRFGLKLDLPLTGSDEISPKGELGYIGFVDLKRDRFFRDYGLNVKIYYGFRNYTNDQNDQEEEVAGVLFSVTSFNWL